MSEYVLNAPVNVEFTVPLTEDAYALPYEFPLVIQKRGVVIDQTTIKSLEKESYTVTIPENCEDCVVKAMRATSEPEKLALFEEALKTVDPIRKPWVVFRILEIARHIKRVFVPMALEAMITYPQAISHASVLSNYYHLNNNYDASYMVGRIALTRPGLFWEKNRVSAINHDLSIVSYWVRDITGGNRSADYCCFHTPGDNNNLKLNRYFYNKEDAVTPDVIRSYPIDTRPTEDGTTVYKPLNPSVVPMGNGYIGTFRTVNYEINKYQWTIFNPDGKWISRNYLLTFDDKMNILTKRELIWEDDTKFPSVWQGIEDIRLIDSSYFTATIPEANPGGYPMQFMCHYDFNTARVVRVIPMFREAGRMEKNWLPFYANNEMKCIYGYNPFTMFSINKITGDITNIVEKKLPINMHGIKGSAPPIPYKLGEKDGYLFVVHESINVDGALQYLSRVVWMDSDFNIKHISRLFRFDNSHQIEMITSVTMFGSNVSFWTGVNDREVFRYVLCKERVDSLLDWMNL